MSSDKPRRSFSIAASRRDIDAQVDEELRFHLDQKTDELIRQGWEAGAARAEAERAFGDLTRVREQCRAISVRRARRRSRMERMGGWIQDLAYGVRQLRRNPGFAFVAIATLALGVGSTTAVFSVVNGVLLRPLAYTEPDELINVWVGPERGVMSGLDIRDIEEQVQSLESLVGVSSSNQTVTGLGEPLVVSLGRATDGLLSVFRLSPLLGRDLPATRNEADVQSVVVIGHGFWQRVYGADPSVLGRMVDVNGISREIIGVAPAGFDFPNQAEMWIPRPTESDGCGRGCHTWRAVGNMSPGTSVETVQAELDRLGPALEDQYPATNTEKRFRAVGLQEDLVGDVRAGLWILLGAVALVLLIACANVANLMLVRASSRTGEMAVRGALGATRTRLIRQTLLESAVLAGLGGAFGLLLARLGVELMKTFAGASIPRMELVSVDGAAALFTIALVAVITLLFGLTPALRSANASLVDSLGQAGRGAQSGAGKRQRGVLVTAEVALSVILLVGAGLLLRTFGALHAVDLGYETENVTRFSLTLPDASYGTLEEIRTFYRTLEAELEGLPGVESVGSVFGAPMGSGNITGAVLVEGRPEPLPADEINGSVKSVSPAYLETLRIPLLQGRLLVPSDDAEALPVAVVNESFVRDVFPGQDPIGERVKVTTSFDYGNPYWTIVGVVKDIRSRSVTADPVAEIYLPHGQFGPGFMSVNLRTAPGAGVPLESIREVVRGMDANLPIRNLETLDQAVADDVAPTRFYLLLVATFAVLALFLAAVGLYGVLAYMVSTRTREIGVRVAMGADRGEITRMVVGDGLRPALAGLAVGLVVALVGGRLLESVLYGVAPRDPVVLAVVPLILMSAATLAALLPALRAGGLQPSEALRAE